MRTAFLLVYGGLTASLLVVSLTNLVWMIDAWRTPRSREAMRRGRSTDSPRLSFSLLVPARHEEAVLSETLRRLAQLDHPCFEIVVIIGHDDHATRAVADEAARVHPGRIWVVTDHNWPKNKPKALNSALPFCRGDIIGVFDAEDEVAPGLLREIDSCFRRTGAHVVQAGVQLMNYRSSWFSLRSVLEYFFYFGSSLAHHARYDFLPLGGNTVFFRRDVLELVGGWDSDCLAEDCEVGVRLSSLGAKTVVLYDAALVTREETPSTLGAFFKQRTRWNQGFLQVLRKGEWRRLPTWRQRLFARYLLTMPFLQAATAVLLPVQLGSMLVLNVPVPLALASFIPMMVMLATLCLEAVALREFCRLFDLRDRPADYGRLLIGTLAYHFVLALSAGRAAIRELRGLRGWEKTDHFGLHRSRPDVTTEVSP